MADLLSKSQVKSEYGLTDKLIGMLGAPDVLKPNPRYHKAAPMAFYGGSSSPGSRLLKVTLTQSTPPPVAICDHWRPTLCWLANGEFRALYGINFYL